MRKITLDEMINEVQTKEAKTKEPKKVTQMLQIVSYEVISAANSGQVEIFTDYDADGICSAYIIENTLKSINPGCEINVRCADRRNSYGLPEDAHPQNEKTHCIVLDMGSNQLNQVRNQLGDDVIIIDHHLIEEDETQIAFRSLEKGSCLCNPHCFSKDESENAQYCATGLAYRIYQECKTICKSFKSTEMQDNTMAVMACIGTATDMVNVLDVNSHNRQILKEGLKIIDNADKNNLDFVIGNILARNSIGEATTAHQIAFNVGAFLNSASRMSEISQSNGAQEMYDAITSDPNFYKTYRLLDTLTKRNMDRKTLIGRLVGEDEYSDFVTEHRFGLHKNDNIGVFQLPDNTPSAMAGLVAGKLVAACDKAIICLTYNSEKGEYSGSGRNSENNKTSLIKFMQQIEAELKYQFKDFEINYGGHEEAIGISNLKDIESFTETVKKNAFLMQSKDISERLILDLAASEINTLETLNKIMALEPTGIGLQIPPVLIEGKEIYRNTGFIKQRDDWKRIKVKTETSPITVSDWNYSPDSYPQTKKEEIALMAELGLNDFQGLHTELSAKFDRTFLEERKKTMDKDIPKGNIDRT